MARTKIRITPFLKSDKFSAEIEEFEPVGGSEKFLRDFAAHLGESLSDWFQGFEEGGGYFTYRGQKLFVYWSAFPLQLSFDCPNEVIALRVKKDLEDFFSGE